MGVKFFNDINLESTGSINLGSTNYLTTDVGGQTDLFSNKNFIVSIGPSLSGVFEFAQNGIVTFLDDSTSTDFTFEPQNSSIRYTGLTHQGELYFDDATLTASRQWILPDATGTIALLSDIEANNELSEVLANGNTTGPNDIIVDNNQSILLDDNTAGLGPSYIQWNANHRITYDDQDDGLLLIQGDNSVDIRVGSYDFGFNGAGGFSFSGFGNSGSLVPATLTAGRTWTLQDGSGTLAFLSDIVVETLAQTLATGNTTSGNNIVLSSGDVISASLAVTQDVILVNGIGDSLGYRDSAWTLSSPAGAVRLQADTEIQLYGGQGELVLSSNAGTTKGDLVYSGITANRTWTLPDATGTIALLSDLTNGIYTGSGNLSSNTVVSMHDGASPGTEFKLGFQNILSETVLSINPSINSVGIGTDLPLANLNVVGNTADAVVFKVDGTYGELFTITDNLTGVLFSVNNISGLPIFEVEDTDEIRMGRYTAVSGYTTGRNEITATGDTIIHTVDISSYRMAVFEYVVSDGTNLRAGNVTAVTDGATVQSVETITTPSIGNTADITMSVTIDASPGELNLVATTASTTGWTVKTIVRTI